MPGPKPMPTYLKVLRGNPGKRRIKPEPQPAIPDSVPDAPTYLARYAREEWNRIAPELYRLRLLTVFDIQPLAAYCVAYERWRTANERLDEIASRDPLAGLVIKTSTKGTLMQSPVFLAARQSARDMIRYASEFGFTPAARARIGADGYGPPKPASKFDGLLA